MGGGADLAAHIGYVAALISREFAETDVSRGFVNGFNFNCLTSGGAGEQAAGFLTEARAPWGEGHHRWFEQHFDHGFGVHAIGDDLPNPENRVSLDPAAVDADGVPIAQLHYRPGENDRRMMRYMLERLVDIAGAAGAFDHRLQDYVDAAGVYRTPAWHLLGTCRMGAVPEMSVVNKWQQCWDVPNLFIVDGSVLTTGGVVEPDADDLRARAARRRAPARQLPRAAHRHPAGSVRTGLPPSLRGEETPAISRPSPSPTACRAARAPLSTRGAVQMRCAAHALTAVGQLRIDRGASRPRALNVRIERPPEPLEEPEEPLIVLAGPLRVPVQRAEPAAQPVISPSIR